MVLVTLIGLFYKIFYSMLLLHIFALSPDLKAVAQAIIVPAKQLSLTFYVIAASTFIYASFGYKFFGERDVQFMYDDQAEIFEVISEEPIVACETLLECTVLLLYKGVPDGDIGSVIDAVNKDSDLFTPRVVFDLTFFIWVGVLLFNILTGSTLRPPSLFKPTRCSQPTSLPPSPRPSSPPSPSPSRFDGRYVFGPT